MQAPAHPLIHYFAASTLVPIAVLAHGLGLVTKYLLRSKVVCKVAKVELDIQKSNRPAGTSALMQVGATDKASKLSVNFRDFMARAPSASLGDDTASFAISARLFVFQCRLIFARRTLDRMMGSA